MLKTLNISSEDIIRNIQLSCQIPEFLEAIAKQQIIAKAASEEGITVSEEELQQEGDHLRLEKKLVTAKDTWTWLKKHHLTLYDFEAIARNNVLARKLAAHLFDKQVEKYFYEHYLDYVTTAIYEVILDDRDLALELFYALQEGEITFQEIARQYIQEPELRCASGYKGIQYRKDLRPEIAAAVFAAHPPETIKPIVTSKGVYLIWVEEIIQPELDEKLNEEIQQELFSLWLKQEIELMEIVPQLIDVSHEQSEELRKQA
ncbi:peptidylprolyl isomerase [Scytonema hofmannii PCC 7110]|uniref:peptidylprolyl isomerase n=1 Tax=Scytonema hofmannii PCC 7110 TaxID=128403 RepID=A0A139WZ20_9CYAN|nr:peptidylprolyl isomerase [Scytonema hofmannii]KYC37678.1 peptidylprolyl isomerase [Scytonema hofmannii PCC 7110]